MLLTTIFRKEVKCFYSESILYYMGEDFNLRKERSHNFLVYSFLLFLLQYSNSKYFFQLKKFSILGQNKDRLIETKYNHNMSKNEPHIKYLFKRKF